MRDYRERVEADRAIVQALAERIRGHMQVSLRSQFPRREFSLNVEEPRIIGGQVHVDITEFREEGHYVYPGGRQRECFFVQPRLSVEGNFYGNNPHAFVRLRLVEPGDANLMPAVLGAIESFARDKRQIRQKYYAFAREEVEW